MRIKSPNTCFLCSINSRTENGNNYYLSSDSSHLITLRRYTARSAAAALAPLAYDRVNDKYKAEIIATLNRLSGDSAPTVRRSVAKSLPLIAKFANTSTLAEIAELYKLFAKDDQDSIRIQIIPVSSVLAEFLSWELKTTVIIPTVILLAGDRAWRVRWCLCHHLKEIFPFLIDPAGVSSGQSLSIINSIASIYDNLLNDPEPEVILLS